MNKGSLPALDLHCPSADSCSVADATSTREKKVVGLRKDWVALAVVSPRYDLESLS